MLERIGRKGSPHSLLVELQMRTAALEIRVVSAQKTDNKSAIRPAPPLLNIRGLSVLLPDACSAMFIAALLLGKGNTLNKVMNG